VNAVRAAWAILLIGCCGAAAAGGPPVRVLIMFGSACCGTDHRASREVSAVIAAQEKKTGRTLAQERVSWGKEGEFNLCLPLTELSDVEQKRFVERIKNALGTSATTRLVQNVPCEGGWTPGGAAR
jgi:hypothetical protein